MLRGSKPGERRGGRDQGTPNRRSILRDRILAIGLEHPAASQRVFLATLVTDPKLPADTRLAIAPQCFPSKRSSRAGRPRALGSNRNEFGPRFLAKDSSAALTGSHASAGVPAIHEWSPDALHALFGLVQDGTANPKMRRRAAQKIAEFLLPKTAKKPKVMPDEYGFSISPALAGAYRDLQLELRALQKDPTRKIPAVAQKLEKLEARSAAIRRRLELPCPTKYGDRAAYKDALKLEDFASLRANKTALTEAQKAEEAHVRARYDVFCAGPESIARRRRAALQDAEQWYRKNQFFGEFQVPPLSRKQQNELDVLRWLYPEPVGKLSQVDADFEWYGDHPFTDESLGADGNFYPMLALLKEAGEGDERKWLEQLEEGKKIRPQAHTDDQQNPQLFAETRIRALEERRASGYDLTASEERELRELRESDPEYAAVMDLMDLPYLCEWRRQVERAKVAGLSTFAACEQAEIVCLRLRDQTKFTTEPDAKEYRRVRSGKATETASFEP